MSSTSTSSLSLLVNNPQKTYNGFTLFTPYLESPSNTWLIDMQGRFVHRWRFPGQVAMKAYLLPNGNLFGGIRMLDGPMSRWTYGGGEILEMDWNSNITWRYKDPYMNMHDWVRKENGNILISRFVEVPKDIMHRVMGSGTEGVLWCDNLQEITADGKVTWEWVAYEHLDPELDAPLPTGTPGQVSMFNSWNTWNSLVELPNGNIMVSSPRTSNIYIIDKATGEIEWRWGKGIVSFQHNPTMLDNGNILVFDNRGGGFPGYSRVLEVNPSTGDVEWVYKADNPVDFYSHFIGGCQRLPNGNTLICEGAKGRLFEVTATGETVWEYVVPFFSRSTGLSIDYGLSNAVHRANRYGPDYPGLQGQKLDAGKLELWNRLYGPAASGPTAQPYEREVEAVSMAEETAVVEKEEPQVWEESKPGVGDPAKGGDVMLSSY